MEPIIRKFPSMQFYDNKIQDGESITTRDPPQVIKTIRESMNSMIFYDLMKSEETIAETSKANVHEA